MTVTLDPDRVPHWRALLSLIEARAREPVPCRAGGLAVTSAWVAEDDAEQRLAAAACRPCPVLGECREYGLAWPREAGVYGGMTERQRQSDKERKSA